MYIIVYCILWQTILFTTKRKLLFILEMFNTLLHIIGLRIHYRERMCLGLMVIVDAHLCELECQIGEPFA